MAFARIILFIGLFGAAGAISRYTLSELTARWFGTGFPYGTLLVNVLGCGMLGALAYVGTSTDALPDVWRAALGAGFLGGLTTFSTFGLETFHHLEKGHLAIAGANVTANLILGLTAVWIGMAAARVLLSITPTH